MTDAPQDGPARSAASLDETLRQRGSVHGDFRDHASATQRLKAVMQSCPNWTALTHVHRDAAEMIAVKLGRILAGDPDHHDHWHDIAGYATLVARDIERRGAPPIKVGGLPPDRSCAPLRPGVDYRAAVVSLPREPNAFARKLNDALRVAPSDDDGA